MRHLRGRNEAPDQRIGRRVPDGKEPVASATEGQRAIRVAMESTLATGHSALTCGPAARVAVVTVDWLLPDS